VVVAEVLLIKMEVMAAQVAVDLMRDQLEELEHLVKVTLAVAEIRLQDFPVAAAVVLEQQAVTDLLTHLVLEEADLTLIQHGQLLHLLE
jgi:hypothetical protein